jgi:PKD repeat protein
MKIRSRNIISISLLLLLTFCRVNAQTNQSAFKELYVAFDDAIIISDDSNHSDFFEDFFKRNPTVPRPIEASFSFAFSKNATLQRIARIRFINATDCLDAVNKIAQIQHVKYVEFVPVNKRFLTPNDLGSNTTASGGQWYQYKIQAQQAWDLQTGNNSVRVAVVDDAVQTNHPELDGVCLPGYDAAEQDMDVEPPTAQHDHGTHVAGLIGALTDNGQGMASLAHGVRIMPVKVTFDSNPDNVASGFEGIAWAVSNGADIINCSWGSETYSQTGLSVIQDALNAGVTVVAAAGNFNNSIAQFPAGYEGVIAVGATTSGDARSSFSSFGTWVDVSAPGSLIWSLAPNDGYQVKNGTSFAAPLVSALAALLKSNNPNLSPSEIQSCIQGSADDIGFLNPSFSGFLGSGRINAYEAIRCVQLDNAAYNVSLSFEDPIPQRMCTGILSPRVRITNTGTETLNTFTVRAQLGNAPPYFYAIDTALAQGESMVLAMQELYPSPGIQTYRVQLVGLLNGLHSDAYSPDNLLQESISVLGGIGESIPFTENFESGSFSTNGWIVENENDAFTWNIDLATSPEPGSKAAVLGYYINSNIASRDYLSTPPLDFSGLGSASLSFDFAYMPRFQNISDSLILSYSANCGESFTRLLALSGSTLATTQAFPDIFIANLSSLWCGASGFAPCVSLNLDSLAGNTNVVFRWEGFCNNGNNLYIDNIRIEGEAAFNAPSAAFSAAWDIPACVGSTIQFQNESTGNPSSFSWSFLGGTPATSTLENPEVSYAEIGVYAVSLIASNDFGSDTILFDNYIQVAELPVVDISTNNDTICGGNSAHLTASGANYYYWNNGPAMSATLGDSVVVSPQNNTTYTVNGVSGEGCIASATQQIFVVTQPVTPQITIDGVNLVASPGIAYEWYLNGVLLPDETSQFLLPTQNGNYNVRVYIQDNCSSISSIFTVNFALNMSLNKSTAINIYPNPTSDLLHIQCEDTDRVIQIFNSSGQSIFEAPRIETIDTSSWSSGLYSLLLTNKNGEIVRHLFEVLR